jgi:hypothetical protein
MSTNIQFNLWMTGVRQTLGDSELLPGEIAISDERPNAYL